MKLSTRLVLLILGCLLPILTAQVYSQINLYAERHEQLSGLVLRQAELANADMASILDAARQVGILAAQFPEIQGSTPGCAERLTALRNGLAPYRFLALLAPTSGGVVCTSAGAPPGLTEAHGQWLDDLLAAHDPTIGPVVSEQGQDGTFVPIGVPIAGNSPNARPLVVVAALSTDWLARHLELGMVDHASPMARTTLTVVDRNGTVVARVPDPGSSTGQMLPDWLRPLIGRDRQGIETLTDPDGRALLASFVPTQTPPVGLAVIDSLPLPAMTADIEQAAFQDLLVISGAAIVAVILAWVAGRRFIYRPTQALLHAARKWREGDLSARASISDAGSEFVALSQSFNAMAAGLQAREMERRLQANFLESQVAERTRELSETNNRLQVEIAGREKTEAALHQAQKLQAVGQLAGGIAHDFNNMLATVLGNLELMERRVPQPGKPWTDNDAEKLQRLIERATGAVQRGGALTSRLLAFSRRQRLAARPTDINALLQELITLASSTLGRRVQVSAELNEALWPAMVDPSQVEAAILNLCLNARDAMPEGGRLTISTANVTVQPFGTEAGSHCDLTPGCYVQVAISDTGVGMTPEVKARAFDPFFTTKGPGAGSGLGLSQVYGMARQSGGGVTIDSEPGHGTRVTLYLPRAQAVEAATTEAPPDLALPTPGSPRELVLVVDDDNAVRQVTVEMARDLGCDVAQASGGEQALAMIDQLPSPPHLILLDYAMPEMNGLQLARELRERGVTAPIALVTGYAELLDADIAAGQLAGLLRKPFTIRELHGLLTQLRAAANGMGAPCLEPGLIEG
jgi:signal transduction histidine kinase/CheY-like chemotaxis protein